MIRIISIPPEYFGSVGALSHQEMANAFPTVASGDTPLSALQDLIFAINEKAVDTENTFLQIIDA